MAELKKVVVIPDSFKGTMTSIQVCNIMEESIKKVFGDCEVEKIPVADGGEGTVDCFLYCLDAEKIEIKTTGPKGEEISAYYAKYGNKAILEMASVAGLPQVEGELDPVHTTTYGLGALIKDAISKGCDDITIGLGGSCTNDGGIGAARAIGVKFYDENDKEFAPYSDEMTKIARIDTKAADELLKGIRITAMCDVTNPMYGENGAAFVFGPQKGADQETVEVLDKNLRALAGVIKKSLGRDVSEVEGAGAAGALGAGILVFMNGELKSGIETVLDLVDFDNKIKGADLIFTGEGRVDSQSLQGKVLSGVTGRSVKENVPVIVVAGTADDSADECYDHGVMGVFAVNRKPVDFSISRTYVKQDLARTMEAIIRFYKAV